MTLHAKSKGLDEVSTHKVNIEDRKIKKKHDINEDAHAIIKEAMFSRTKRQNILENMHHMLENQQRLNTDVVDANKLTMPRYP